MTCGGCDGRVGEAFQGLRIMPGGRKEPAGRDVRGGRAALDVPEPGGAVGVAGGVQGIGRAMTARLVCTCGHSIDAHSDYHPCPCNLCVCRRVRPVEENVFVEEYSDKAVRIPGAKAKKDTKAALLVAINGEEHWIPQSQIHEDSEVFKPGTEGDLIVARWFAEQRRRV